MCVRLEEESIVGKEKEQRVGSRRRKGDGDVAAALGAGVSVREAEAALEVGAVGEPAQVKLGAQAPNFRVRGAAPGLLADGEVEELDVAEVGVAAGDLADPGPGDGPVGHVV
eukprot:CAMPEP_0198665398 /NCGR_PEP_ID=MMETSP1467-20131203/60274_1 /TAXON_ID=1462469 /ORGANISM="unid. sp., Strain CCMP2135" /LENGTH=111 /DNA_ID=CAMNT_0044401989 /DNA_START=66 /DNA_END=399 /DNA_ORIENTATION=-